MPYPISRQATLQPVQKQRLRRAARAAGEIPMPESHEVLVVSDGVRTYRSDQKRMGPSEEHVLSATSYSIVDMRKDRPIAVQMPIQSDGVEEFTLRVTFRCSVTDPEAVAQSGHADLSELLLAYVKGYHRIRQIGLQHAVEAVALAQDDALTELSIYANAKPPMFYGMHVELLGVEVLNPAKVLEEKQQQEEQLKEHRRKHFEMELERETIERRRAFEQVDLKYTRDRTLADQRFETDLDREKTDYAHEKRQRDLAADLRHAQIFARETADDPYAVISYALARGELNSGELLRRIDQVDQRRQEIEQEDRQRRHAWETANDDREWEAHKDRLAFEREMALKRQELETTREGRGWELRREEVRLKIENENRLQQFELGREDRDWERRKDELRLEQEKELRLQQLQSARDERDWADRKVRQEWQQEKERYELQMVLEREKDRREAKLSLLRGLIERGHTDQIPMNEVVEQMIGELAVSEPSIEPPSPADHPPALETSSDQVPERDGD